MESRSQNTEVRSRNKNLTPGQVVPVYADPITELHKEGDAQLIKCTDPNLGFYNGEQLQRWRVCFLNDNYVTERTIKASKVL